jgi:hypothetical protein
MNYEQTMRYVGRPNMRSCRDQLSALASSLGIDQDRLTAWRAHGQSSLDANLGAAVRHHGDLVVKT